MMAAPPPPSNLRARRQQRGMTQAELAGRARVSRQLVAAAEAGHHTPAVDAAIRIAQALSCSVEELFTAPPAGVVGVLGDTPAEGAVLRLARVGELLVGAEPGDHGVAGGGWEAPDAVWRAGRLELLPGAVAAGLALAGCDPALGIAEGMLRGRGAHSLLAVPAPTGAALEALARGRVHAAIVHGPAGALPEPPIPVLRLHFARWQVGLASAGPPATLEAVLGGTVAVVQRDPQAASQQALARAAAVAGATLPPGPRADGHIEAARMAAILGCAAVTTEAAARAFGLRFTALEEHTVQLWVASRWEREPAVETLGELLAGAAFIERVAQFAGYELTGCGTRVGGD